jgi:hypothetical protein
VTLSPRFNLKLVDGAAQVSNFSVDLRGLLQVRNIYAPTTRDAWFCRIGINLCARL